MRSYLWSAFASKTLTASVGNSSAVNWSRIPDSLTRGEGCVDEVVKHLRQLSPPGFTGLTYCAPHLSSARTLLKFLSVTSLLPQTWYCTILINWTVTGHGDLCFVEKMSRVMGHMVFCPCRPTRAHKPSNCTKFFLASRRVMYNMQ